MDVAHTAIWVTDVDRAVEFYRAIGFERTRSFDHEGSENVYVGDPDGHGEVQLKYDPDRTTPVAPNRADVDHLAFQVEDVDETFEDAVAAGGSEVRAPTNIEQAGARVAFVEDPEGYTFELFAPLDE